MRRAIKYWFQRRIRGFDDSDLWDLDSTLITWLLPRLRAFKAKTFGHPRGFDSEEAWKEAIGEMIWAFEQHNNFAILTGEEAERRERGFELFGKYLRSLWD